LPRSGTVWTEYLVEALDLVVPLAPEDRAAGSGVALARLLDEGRAAGRDYPPELDADDLRRRLEADAKDRGVTPSRVLEEWLQQQAENQIGTEP
jgi:hypothetical protein